jgi:hypothetical protein
MSEETVDMLAGLHAVVAVLQAIRVDLGELYRRHEIGPTEHVRLDSLGWAVDRLGDDLHDVNVELRNLRLEVASAQREAEEAQKTQRDEWQDAQTHFEKWRAELETVKAERDAARQQVAELSKKAGGLPPEPAEPYQWQVGDIIEGSAFTRRRVEQIHDGWVLLQGMGSPQSQPDWERRGWKLFRKASDSPQPVAELSGNSGELPAEPTPEPYQWQVGDELVGADGTIHTITQAMGGLLWFKNQTLGASAQWWLTENGFRLHRKALPRLKPRYHPIYDLPDIPPLTPQQVAEFAEATEPIDDSVGTDGEGHS